jgi:hypothetical protein
MWILSAVVVDVTLAASIKEARDNELNEREVHLSI